MLNQINVEEINKRVSSPLGKENTPIYNQKLERLEDLSSVQLVLLAEETFTTLEKVVEDKKLKKRLKHFLGHSKSIKKKVLVGYQLKGRSLKDMKSAVGLALYHLEG